MAWELMAGRSVLVFQPWDITVWRLALPKVEAPGHSRHPAPLSDTVVNNVIEKKSVLVNL